jgi:hypothetical protein
MSDDERQLIGISKISRHKVIERLKTAYANDHLEEVDFERRLELATNTSSRDILKELVDDLPESQDAAAESPSPPVDQPFINHGAGKKHDTFVSFLSGVNRRGDWRPARRLKVISVLGGVELDFSETTLPPDGIDIDVFCLMGGLEIRVPEGVNVDARPVAIMGGTEHRGIGHYGASSPTIRIRGFLLMGGIEVKPPRKNYLRKFLKKMFTDE